MRTLTLQQTATLKCASGYRTQARVKVLRSDGVTWVDLGAFLGVDWVGSIQWDDTNDKGVSGCTAEFFRGTKRISLSPLDAGSPVVNGAGTLLAPGCVYTVEVATIPSGSQPKSGDWIEAWRGYADMVDVEEERVRLTGRDFGGRLDDTFIEAEEPYGSTSGVAVQTVMQQILNRWGFSAVGLYTPVDPLWQLGPYVQKKEGVGEALRTLAQQLGWDVRYLWRNGVGWSLTFWSPDRLKSVVDWVVPANAVLDTPRITVDGTQCRNVVDVVYSDTSDRDASGNPKRKKVTSTDPSSISAIGRRWMEVAEAASSNINTSTEAQRLADAAIADLSLPCTVVEVSVGFSWHLQIGDLVQIPAFEGYNSSPIVGAVEKVAHSIDDGGAKTTLTLRGQPAMNRDMWMQRACAPGYAPQIPFTGPSAPSGLTATPVVNGFAVSFTPAATGVPWASYELHLSKTSGFTPDTSSTSTTFKARTTTTRFEVTDLAAGTTYYARVLPLDSKKNYGPASDEVTVAGRYVEPRNLQPTITYGALPLNGSFEAQNDSAAPPDNWTISVGTWGVSYDAFSDATTSFTGTRSVAFNPTANAVKMLSGLWAIGSTETVRLDVAFSASVAGSYGAVSVVYYDAAGSEIISNPITTLTVAPGQEGVWIRLTDFGSPTSASVRYGRIRIEANAVRPASVLRVDNVRVRELALGTAPFVTVIPAAPYDMKDAARWPTGYYAAPSTGSVVLCGVVRGPSSAAAANTTVMTLPPAVSPPRDRLFRRSWSDGTQTDIEVLTTGVVRFQTTPGGSAYIGLDGLVVQLQS